MISIVDYGMGNLHSVRKALEKMGFESRLVSTASEVEEAERLILPGVGAFGDAMRGLHDRNLVPALKAYARSDRPMLGICLGMQILFESSEEDPEVEGLGIFPGTVRRFQLQGLKVPHMGWNNLRIAPESQLLAGLEPDPYVYFVHSFYVSPEDSSVTAAECTYGHPFTAVVERSHVGGTQFHPEKSQSTGLAILRNFAISA